MTSTPRAPEVPAPGEAGLRAEHDALGERLAARRSVDEVRKALYLIFFGLLSVGLTVKLAWDRWGALGPGVARKLHPGPPLFLWIATAATLVLLVLAIRAFLRARRLVSEEEALFARYRALRDALGLDP
jgi:heme exporter protein D